MEHVLYFIIHETNSMCNHFCKKSIINCQAKSNGDNWNFKTDFKSISLPKENISYQLDCPYYIGMRE